MSGTLAALKNVFASQNVSTEIPIGETGWPTRGAQPAQPNAVLASVQQTQWYAQAMQSWSMSNDVKTIRFEAYDEP
jgi:exo-beta-1,3-glucanase (GH17 family)